jgi:hypothetical protein
MRSTLAILVLICCSAGAILTNGGRRTERTASITWSHDLPTAERLSRDSGKPILWLEDEDDRGVFDRALSHPIALDAAATLFTPLVTSAGASDTPTIRFVDADGHELSPNSSDELTTAVLLKRMVVALQTAHQNVPAYLQLVADEYNPASPQSATFAVGCYWEGEREIGKLPGVVATRTGTLNGDEVVQVDYDASRVGYADLLRQVGSMQCFRSTVVPGAAAFQASDVQQFTLAQHPEYWYLPLTALQATKLNSLLSQPGNADPDELLSPTQRAMHAQLRDIISRGNDGMLQKLSVDRSVDGLAAYSQTVRRMIAQFAGQ